MSKVFIDIHEAYAQALKDVWHTPQFTTAPRGLPVREILNYTFTVTNPVAEPIRTADKERNKVIAEYTAKEVELYNSCSNRVEDFAKASKFWNHIANPDGTINSAYGYLIWKNKSVGNPVYEYLLSKNENPVINGMRTPYEWVLETLKADKDTRQAVLRFSLPEHHYLGVRDFTCTMHANFLIRDNTLNMSVVMRSNDLCKGLVYDMVFFIQIMDRLIEDLIGYYPNLQKGSYTHLAHSMHIYEKDSPIIKRMLGENV